MRLKNQKGFTLIELMVVIAIIGVLAAIAVPKFADVIRKSKEGATKGSLGSLRSAIAIYYGQMEGEYPTQLDTVPFLGTFIENIPEAKTGTSISDVSTVKHGGGIDNAGGWYYDSTNGQIRVNSTETDTKGDYISSW